MSPKHNYSLEFEKRIVEEIRRYPFIGLRELGRELNTSAQLLKYHIDFLLEQGTIRAKKDGKYLRYYCSWIKIEEYEETILKCFRKPQLMKVIMLFFDKKQKNKSKILKNNDLVELLELGSAGTVTYYTNQLLEAEILIKSNKGFELANPIYMRALVEKYKPTPTVIDNFVNIWLEFFK